MNWWRKFVRKTKRDQKYWQVSLPCEIFAAFWGLGFVLVVCFLLKAQPYSLGFWAVRQTSCSRKKDNNVLDRCGSMSLCLEVLVNRKPIWLRVFLEKVGFDGSVQILWNAAVPMRCFRNMVFGRRGCFLLFCTLASQSLGSKDDLWENGFLKALVLFCSQCLSPSTLFKITAVSLSSQYVQIVCFELVVTWMAKFQVERRD